MGRCPLEAVPPRGASRWDDRRRPRLLRPAVVSSNLEHAGGRLRY